MEKREFSLLESPTIMLVLANIIVYICTSILSGTPLVTNRELMKLIGQYNRYVIYKGYYWQLFTSMFVHADIGHLANNMIFLLIFGLRAEELFREREYLAIYFVSGIFGNILTLLIFTWILGPDVLSVGASGAIFGIFGACIVYIYQSIIAVAFYSMILFMMSSGAGVNVFAHFGGLVIGLLLGYYFAKMRRYNIVYRAEYRI
ncbi:rhomboid family intramembrane serine protease [Candidatus Bathyarchaeota archaeon]|nr:rhomboid family intramembrane serine protease [Candidatus Bathyarchaeota archaeon]